MNNRGVDLVKATNKFIQPLHATAELEKVCLKTWKMKFRKSYKGEEYIVLNLNLLF